MYLDTGRIRQSHRIILKLFGKGKFHKIRKGETITTLGIISPLSLPPFSKAYIRTLYSWQNCAECFNLSHSVYFSIRKIPIYIGRQVFSVI
jgi:hypothetical protein